MVRDMKECTRPRTGFVRACSVCMRNKTEHLQPGGLLQPLGVPFSV